MEKAFWNTYGAEIVQELGNSSKNQHGESSDSESVIEIDLVSNGDEFDSNDKLALLSRIDKKLDLVNQKLSILVDNAEDLNLKDSKLRAFVREVLLQESLGGK